MHAYNNQRLCVVSTVFFTVHAFSLAFRDEELRFLKGARPSPSFGPTHPSGKNLSSIHSRRPNSPSCGLEGVQQYSSQNGAVRAQFECKWHQRPVHTVTHAHLIQPMPDHISCSKTSYLVKTDLACLRFTSV